MKLKGYRSGVVAVGAAALTGLFFVLWPSAPTLVGTVPTAGSSGVSLDASVLLTLSKEIDEASISENAISLRDAADATVPTSVTYDRGNRAIALTPRIPLKAASAYSVKLAGGERGIADASGRRLAGDVVVPFSTVSFGAATGGPGGPILVITHESNPFSRYYAEILLAEGMNAFELKDISEVSAATLAATDVAILGAIPLDTEKIGMLTEWVKAGGNLIAMRPDKKLAELLGLTDAGSVVSNGYLLVNTMEPPGKGIVGESIQYHGEADRYKLSTAISVADLYSDAVTATPNPAVTLRSVGDRGGQAAAFTFDLARSIVLTRQGNPEWAGQERDGTDPIRSSDLFYGAASFDPRADWIDLDKVAIPQADEQQRLLANMITAMNGDRKLLPRFWYLPHGHSAAIVLTGDDHASNGTKGRFKMQRELSSGEGAVEDWQQIRSTSYVFVNRKGMSNREAEKFTAGGFELGVHLNSKCENYTAATFDALLTQQLAAFKGAYPGVPTPRTNRNHCIVWCGYTTTAEVQARHGIQLDTNYYFWPPDWVLNRPGFMTGSGMPMRFATNEGAVINCYQAATHMTDESGQIYPFTVNRLLDKAMGPEGYYGAFVANMHTDKPSIPEASAIVASAMDREVPVISALQLLNWTEGRNSSSFSDLAWNDNKLSFSIKAGTGSRGMKAMVPFPNGANLGAVRRDGQTVPYTVRTVKGIQYGFFDARSGAYEVQFIEGSAHPQITQMQTVSK